MTTEATERTFPLGAVARLTGLSPELLRAWERRHGAVSPLRTPGGTRRYRASDLERLRRLKAAVDAGHRIGELAGLSNEELEPLGGEVEVAVRPRLEDVLAALGGFDGAEAQRLLALHLATLGAVPFAREVATPLAREIGERWADRRLTIASEHLATALLRSLLGSALQPGVRALRGARVVLATLEGERHEMGLLMAALVAMGAGANPIYLGPEVPASDLVDAARRSGAAALALSFVAAPAAEAVGALAALRDGLPSAVQLWIGGAASARIATPQGVERISSLDALEQRVGMLDFERPR